MAADAHRRGPVDRPVPAAHFQYITPDGTSRHIWNTPLRTGAWQTFGIGFRVSRNSDGWTQLWYNSARQTFTNGATQFDGPTRMGREVKAKWGLYRTGPASGNATAWLNRPHLGTTLADVASPAS